MVGAEGAAVPRSVRQVHPVEVAHQVVGRTWMALTPRTFDDPQATRDSTALSASP